MLNIVKVHVTQCCSVAYMFSDIFWTTVEVYDIKGISQTLTTYTILVTAEVIILYWSMQYNMIYLLVTVLIFFISVIISMFFSFFFTSRYYCLDCTSAPVSYSTRNPPQSNKSHVVKPDISMLE